MGKVLRYAGVFRYRVTVPRYLEQAVPAIYLGMPPLPLSTNKPLVGKGSDEHVATFGGIGGGSIKPTSQSKGTKGIDQSGGVINFGSDVKSGNVRRRKNTVVKGSNSTKRRKRIPNGSRKTKSKAAKAAGVLPVLKRGKNGRFQK